VAICFPKMCLLTVTGLHCVVYHKLEHFTILKRVGKSPTTDCCLQAPYGSKTSGCVRIRKFLDELSDFYFAKKDSASWRYLV
jgi:hypothetical protein